MTNTNLLRRVLFADAAISGVSGLLLLFGADFLSRAFDVPAEFLRYAGVSLVPFTAFVLFVATRGNIARASVWTIIVLNVAWVLGSFALLMVDGIDPNGIGVAFIVAQAVAVAAFAEIQYVGLRRATAA